MPHGVFITNELKRQARIKFSVPLRPSFRVSNGPVSAEVLKSIACQRAGIENLRPHDLRGTFATRLLDRGIPIAVISSLLGHKRQGRESRITLGYARTTWEMMVWAVESLEHPLLFQNAFQLGSGKIQEKQAEDGTQQEIAKAS